MMMKWLILSHFYIWMLFDELSWWWLIMFIMLYLYAVCNGMLLQKSCWVSVRFLNPSTVKFCISLCSHQYTNKICRPCTTIRMLPELSKVQKKQLLIPEVLSYFICLIDNTSCTINHKCRHLDVTILTVTSSWIHTQTCTKQSCLSTKVSSSAHGKCWQQTWKQTYYSNRYQHATSRYT